MAAWRNLNGYLYAMWLAAAAAWLAMAA